MEKVIGRWLTPWRIRLYAGAVLVAAAGAFVALLVFSKDLITPQGVPLGSDFVAFYAAGALVASGHPEAVFAPGEVQRAQDRALGKSELPGYHAWVYPPYVALMLAPISLLPYLTAYVVYTALMVAAVWAGMRFLSRLYPWIARHPIAIFAAAVSFYPMLRSVTSGQNTAITFMLMSAALAMLSVRREVAAGIFLGLMMFKPHFAIPIIGLALVARYWTAVLVSVAVSGGYFLSAALVFGWDWPAKWWHVLGGYREIEAGINGPYLISFLGVAEQLVGPADPTAWTIAAIPTIFVIGLLVVFFSKVGRETIELSAAWGVAAIAIVLISPHSQFYELGLFILPAVLLANRRRSKVALPLLIIWVLSWTHAVVRALWEEPLVQPLFFVALAGFLLSLTLRRTKSPLAPNEYRSASTFRGKL